MKKKTVVSHDIKAVGVWVCVFCAETTRKKKSFSIYCLPAIDSMKFVYVIWYRRNIWYINFSQKCTSTTNPSAHTLTFCQMFNQKISNYVENRCEDFQWSNNVYYYLKKKSNHKINRLFMYMCAVWLQFGENFLEVFEICNGFVCV